MTTNDMHSNDGERNSLTPFQFDGRNIRLTDKNGEFWFVAGDAAAELAYTNTNDLTRLLDDDEKGAHIVRTLGGDQEISVISEAGLYRAIVQRRATKKMDEKLKARLNRFQRWVFHDVLPSIRKTGSYSVTEPAPAFDLPKSFAEALRLAADQSEKIAAQAVMLTEMQPKAEFHDAVAEAINAQPINAIAKVLGTGQNRMFKWLREMGILMGDNMPYQRFINDKYFRVVERQYKDNVGESHTYTRTLVTGKGLAYIQKKWHERRSEAA